MRERAADHPNITVTGPLAVALFASTSGTDSDFVGEAKSTRIPTMRRKIFVSGRWPQSPPDPGRLNGYDCRSRMEVRRGRYLKVF